MPVRPAQGGRSSDICSLTCTCTGRFYRYDLQSRARKIIPRRSLVRSVRPVTSNSGMFSREAASAPSYGHLSVPCCLLADAVSELLRLRVSSTSPLLRQGWSLTVFHAFHSSSVPDASPGGLFMHGSIWRADEKQYLICMKPIWLDQGSCLRPN